MSADKKKRRSGTPNGRPESGAIAIEEKPRQSFTQGWDDDINYRDALPIIDPKTGKVVRVRVPEKPGKPLRTFRSSIADDEDVDEGGDDNEEDGFGDNSGEIRRDGQGRMIGKGGVKGKESAKQGGEEEEASDSRLTVSFVDKLAIHDAKILISQICSDITSNPERSVKKKKKSDGKDADSYFALSDMFVILQCSNIEILELAFPSASIVFMDVLPGYKIRQWDKTDSETTLKKETKRTKDFEMGILNAYQRFIGVLNKSVTAGLGNPKRKVDLSTEAARAGLICLNCVGEMIKRLHYFNFRSHLLSIVIARAAQSQRRINSIALECLNSLLQMDNDGELSFEIIRSISKIAGSFEFNIPTDLIKCLQYAKLGVHADEAAEIRKKAKAEKKKRKRTTDEAMLGLMEADAVKDKSQKKRLLIDCLQEIVMIYFRIVKQKVGFNLLPVALEGLGKVSHLVNIDMVEDLIVILKGILEKGAEVPMLVRALCVNCAIKTLSGPGQELSADVDVFIKTLKVLLIEMPCDFDRWDSVLESVEYSLLHRRELRVGVVRMLVYALILRISFMDGKLAKIATSMAHTILIRYPNIRLGLSFMTGNNSVEEDTGSSRDLAMQGLVTADRSKSAKGGLSNTSLVGLDSTDDDIGDSSWIFLLQKHNVDAAFNKLVQTVANRDIVPIAYQLGGASNISATEALDMAWKGVAPERPVPAASIATKNGSEDTRVKGKKAGYFKTIERSTKKKSWQKKEVGGGGISKPIVKSSKYSSKPVVHSSKPIVRSSKSSSNSSSRESHNNSSSKGSNSKNRQKQAAFIKSKKGGKK